MRARTGRVTAHKLPIALSLSVALVQACGASQAGRAATPGGRGGEVTVEEAAVVTARSGPEAGLPPLPVSLSNSSPEFREGYRRALDLLDAPAAPAPPSDDATAYEVWMHNAFSPWIEGRARDVELLGRSFETLAQHPPSEHVVAAALVGLIYQRTHRQFLQIAPPPQIGADAVLADRYRLGLYEAAGRWVVEAQQAFQHCAQHAARQTQSAFGLWLELCQGHLAELDATLAEVASLKGQVRAADEAARLAAIGPRPAGPEICWQARDQAGEEKPLAAAAAPTTTPAPSTPAPGAPSTKSAPRAARCDSPSAFEIAPPSPRNPRDRAFGVRDAATGVRVFVAPQDATAAPLAAAATQQRLAACYAAHVADKSPAEAAGAAVIALHLSVERDARGGVAKVQLTDERSELAIPAPKALRRCIEKGLKVTRLDCGEVAGPSPARAVVCMLRESEPAAIESVESLERLPGPNDAAPAAPATR